MKRDENLNYSSKYAELTSLLKEIFSFIDINHVSNNIGKVNETKTFEFKETYSRKLFKLGLSHKYDALLHMILDLSH